MAKPDEHNKPVQPLPEQWAVDACVKIMAIRSLAEVAMATPARGDPAKREVVRKAIDKFLYAAQEAIRRDAGRQKRGPIDRWRGTSVVVTYQSLHAAEVFLVDLLPDEKIMVLVPSVVTRAQAVLDPADPRRAAIDHLPQRAMERQPGYRAEVQQAMRIGYDASDRIHVRVRNLRNMLLASAALITVLMGVLVGLVSLQPNALPLCFAPGSEATAATTPIDEAKTVCPSGDRKHPSSGDILIVAGLGLLGGALAAAFSIRNVQGTSTPYDVPIALALLKLPLGALTAVSCILLLGGRFVPGLSELDNQRQILAYALVFGYAQQLVSRLIDNQAHTVLNSLPSRDPNGRKPALPTASVSTQQGQKRPGVAKRVRLAIRGGPHRSPET